mgnify:CR=1 FL=1
MTTPGDKKGKMLVRDLLPIEQEFSKINRWMHISTLTWFAGNHEAAAVVLRQKVSDLLVANPWLAGRFERHFCNCKVVLVHPQSTSKNSKDVTKKHFRHVAPKKGLCRKTPMENLAKYCNKFYATQSKCLWKVTVIPCWEKPNEHFAVIHSMSHVIADGFTYYRIHNMLVCSDSEKAKDNHDNTTTTTTNGCVSSLNPQRIMDTVSLQESAMGKDEMHVLSSAGALVGAI